MVTLLLSIWRISNTDGAQRILWVIVVLLTVAIVGGVASVLVTVANLRYELLPEALKIQLGRSSWLIPYTQIVDLSYHPHERVSVRGYERFWPGARFGFAQTSHGRWRNAATTAPNRRVRLQLDSGLVAAISPERPIQFMDALTERLTLDHGARQPAAPPEEPRGFLRPQQDLGPDDSVFLSAGSWALDRLEERFVPVGFFRRQILADQIISNAIALSLIVFAIGGVFATYAADGVKGPTAYHWNPVGEPDRFLRSEGPWVFEGIWLYPVMGLLILGVNLALATLLVETDRFLARMLVGAAPVLSLLALVAMVRLVQ